MLRKLLVLVLALVLFSGESVWADSNADVTNALSQGAVYLSPPEVRAGHAQSGDSVRLQRAVDDAGRRGVPLKIAVVSHYPKKMRNPMDAADHLRTFIDFSGALILVSPHGLGISSDYLSSATATQIVHRVGAHCGANYTDCAVRAAQAVVPEVRAEQSRANRNAAVFWAVTLVIFGVIVAVLVLAARRRQQRLLADWRERGDLTLPPGIVTSPTDGRVEEQQ